MRRLVALIVLSGMLIHCAGKLGFLSYLYQQRHEIANTLGWIEEVPIALCSSDYQADSHLVIHDVDTDQSAPPAMFHARDIQLFYQAKTEGQLMNNLKLMLGSVDNTPYLFPAMSDPLKEILQPPKI